VGPRIEAQAEFDGWGYRRVVGTSTATSPTEVGQITIPGVRVVDITNPAAPQEVGHYIDPRGNNFWGVAVAEDQNGDRIILESDRDFGLFIFRDTGPIP
jgi:hypothetical protein